MKPDQWSSVRYFKPEEFSEPELMDPDFIFMLDEVRAIAEVPIFITSSFRQGDPKAHGSGFAVDISERPTNPDGRNLSSRWRFFVVDAAIRVGFTRIGVYDKHIHLDSWPSGPTYVMWFGESK